MPLHNPASQIRARAVRAALKLVRLVRDTWRKHRARLIGNTGYAATLAAAAAALATETDIAELIAAAIGGLLAIYRSVRPDESSY